jgi:hypothetical protein
MSSNGLFIQSLSARVILSFLAGFNSAAAATLYRTSHITRSVVARLLLGYVDGMKLYDAGGGSICCRCCGETAIWDHDSDVVLCCCYCDSWIPNAAGADDAVWKGGRTKKAQ